MGRGVSIRLLVGKVRLETGQRERLSSYGEASVPRTGSAVGAYAGVVGGNARVPRFSVGLWQAGLGVGEVLGTEACGSCDLADSGCDAADDAHQAGLRGGGCMAHKGGMKYDKAMKDMKGGKKEKPRKV